jgi:hypothetical protein
MAGLLWIVAGVVQLCAVTLYYTVGLGTGFWLLQLFVLLTFALTLFQIWAKRGQWRL